jgi:hypothetical protein
VPELLALNKADLLDEVSRARLTRLFPGVPMISAATGEGVDDLLDAIADRLPHPEVELTALIPYDRGDLVDRVHREGEILELEHVAEGTQIRLRAPAALAHALDPYRLDADDKAAEGSPAGRGHVGHVSAPTRAVGQVSRRPQRVAWPLEEVPADVHDHMDAAPRRGVEQADAGLEVALVRGGRGHDGEVGHGLAGDPVDAGDQRDHVAVAGEGAQVAARGATGDGQVAGDRPGLGWDLVGDAAGEVVGVAEVEDEELSPAALGWERAAAVEPGVQVALGRDGVERERPADRQRRRGGRGRWPPARTTSRRAGIFGAEPPGTAAPSTWAPAWPTTAPAATIAPAVPTPAARRKRRLVRSWSSAARPLLCRPVGMGDPPRRGPRA